MSCDDCPKGFDIDDDELENPQFGRFLKDTFINLMTPRIVEMNVAFEIATPIDTGQQILNEAREDVEVATKDAETYINDLTGFQDFTRSEIEAIGRLYEIDGFEVKTVIRVSDSPRIRRHTQGL